MSLPLIRVELHAHTVHSHDGHMRFDSMLKMARRLKLHAIAITDHDTVEGAFEFQDACRRRASEVSVIVGEERTLEDGSHLIGLFLHAPISSTSFEEALREIRSQGSICVLPHPFRHRDGILRQGARLNAACVGFEIFNPTCSHAENLRSRDLLGSGMFPVGGSDAHFEGDLGQCVNLVPLVGDLKSSITAIVEGRLPCRVLGTVQEWHSKGREYAALYYRVKPFVRLPRCIVPAATALYRVYRNYMPARGSRELEQKA